MLSPHTFKTIKKLIKERSVSWPNGRGLGYYCWTVCSISACGPVTDMGSPFRSSPTLRLYILLNYCPLFVSKLYKTPQTILEPFQVNLNGQNISLHNVQFLKKSVHYIFCLYQSQANQEFNLNSLLKYDL